MDNLRKDGMKIGRRAAAMKRGKIEDKNVQPFAVIESNVLENIVVLQNKGYAYMPAVGGVRCATPPTANC